LVKFPNNAQPPQHERPKSPAKIPDQRKTLRSVPVSKVGPPPQTKPVPGSLPVRADKTDDQKKKYPFPHRKLPDPPVVEKKQNSIPQKISQPARSLPSSEMRPNQHPARNILLARGVANRNRFSSNGFSFRTTKGKCVCDEETTLYNFRNCKGAAHPICLDCIFKMISVSIENGEFAISCQSCNSSLQFQEVVRYLRLSGAPRRLEELYQTIYTQREREANCHERKMITCLNPDCGSQQDIGGESVVTCRQQYCKWKMCAIHNRVYMGGKFCCSAAKDPSCDSSEWVVAHTKSCPNCNAPIEKNGGCDHMTCKKSAGGCGFEFCWVCLTDFEQILQTEQHHLCCTHSYAPIGKSTPKQQLQGLDLAAARVVL